VLTTKILILCRKTGTNLDYEKALANNKKFKNMIIRLLF
jgi:hypothetical protein